MNHITNKINHLPLPSFLKILIPTSRASKSSTNSNDRLKQLFESTVISPIASLLPPFSTNSSKFPCGNATEMIPIIGRCVPNVGTPPPQPRQRGVSGVEGSREELPEPASTITLAVCLGSATLYHNVILRFNAIPQPTFPPDRRS